MNIYTLLYYRHQIGSMNPLFVVRSWNNGVCCMSFYILILLILKTKAATCVCRGFQFKNNICLMGILINHSYVTDYLSDMLQNYVVYIHISTNSSDWVVYS